jgi:hypothetical protein
VKLDLKLRLGRGGGYHPTREANAIIWLDSSMVVQSGTVSQVTDQTGNGRHAIQGTATNQPTYVASDATFKNKPCISHDGTDNYLDVAAFASKAQPVAVYGCVRMAALGSRFLFDDLDGSSRVAIFDNNAGAMSIFAGNGANGGAIWVINSTLVFCVIFNGANAEIYINDPVTELNPSANSGTNALASMRIGARFNMVSFFSGKWAALGAFEGAHNVATRTRVMNYLISNYQP